ncbi:hypothetical protein EB72_00100 [Mycobacterium sp. SWH-M1]|nr:hypothetical protein EB72_00100 [Mycobacterium sp. SWH-M1]
MATTRRIDREVVGVVILLAVVLASSDLIAGGVFDVVGRSASPLWRAGVLVADVVVLTGVASLKRQIGRIEGGPSRLWGWWWTGFAIACGVDGLYIVVGDAAAAVDAVSAAALVAAVAVLMMSSVNADPRTLFSSRARAAMPTDWQRVSATVPLIVGSCAACLGAAVWTDYFEPNAVRVAAPEILREITQLPLYEQHTALAQLCSEGVNPAYFQHIAEALPVLLLTLGVEFNFFGTFLRDPVQRVSTLVTVSVMCLALVLALSTLPFDGSGCDDVLTGWHEYVAFTVTLQAVFMALTTMVWLMLAKMSSSEPATGDAVTQ